METPGRTFQAASRLASSLRLAVGLEAIELTFFSGVGAYITTATGKRRLPMSLPSSAQRVRDLHEACLAIADRDHLQGLPYCRYSVSFPGIGSFSCEYVERRGTANLQLRRGPDASEGVEVRTTPNVPRRPMRSALPQPESRAVDAVAPLLDPISRSDVTAAYLQ
jgi:hypothetical protein